MAKREYFEKRLVDVTAEGWEYELFPITEQDIIKPYLDKLREELRTEAMEHSGTGEEVIQAYVDGLYESIKRINNLLSEQGDTENE